MRTATLLLAILLAPACRSEPVFVEMSDSTFVQTMVALRRLPVGTFDTVARARQRDAILERAGVTAAQLESTAVRLAADPERAATIWRAIENATPRTP